MLQHTPNLTWWSIFFLKGTVANVEKKDMESNDILRFEQLRRELIELEKWVQMMLKWRRYACLTKFWNRKLQVLQNLSEHLEWEISNVMRLIALFFVVSCCFLATVLTIVDGVTGTFFFFGKELYVQSNPVFQEMGVADGTITCSISAFRWG